MHSAAAGAPPGTRFTGARARPPPAAGRRRLPRAELERRISALRDALAGGGRRQAADALSLR